MQNLERVQQDLCHPCIFGMERERIGTCAKLDSYGLILTLQRMRVSPSGGGNNAFLPSHIAKTQTCSAARKHYVQPIQHVKSAIVAQTYARHCSTSHVFIFQNAPA